MTDLSPFIEKYIANFDYIREREKYKWTFLKSFKDNFDIESKDFHENLSNALDKSKNLLDSSSNYLPKTTILEIARHYPEEVRQLFKMIVTPDKDVVERMISFIDQSKRLASLCYKQGVLKYDKSHQDAHALSVYLSMYSPDTFYIYKTSMFCDFTQKINYHITPSSKGGVNNIHAYIQMCHEIEDQLFANKSIMELHNRWLDKYKFVGIDSANHMLTQDFIYAVFYHFNQLNISIKANKPTELTAIVNTIESNQLKIKLKEKTSFKPIKDNDYFNDHKRQKKLGNEGEVFVVEYEKKFLADNNRADLAKKVEHVSKTKGDGLGYDVLSYDLNGKERYIEVKTTRGTFSQEFFITANELEFSKRNAVKYWLYRVYDFNPNQNSGCIEMIHGDISNLCVVPTTFSVRIDK